MPDARNREADGAPEDSTHRMPTSSSPCQLLRSRMRSRVPDGVDDPPLIREDIEDAVRRLLNDLCIAIYGSTPPVEEQIVVGALRAAGKPPCSAARSRLATLPVCVTVIASSIREECSRNP